MTQRSNFDSETIIKKLVDHYGLPAFLFSINSSNTFDLNINTKPISVILISYSEYPNLSAITGEKPGIFILEDHWRSTEHIIASKISWHLKLHEKIDARVCSVIEISAIDAEQFLAKNHLMQYAMAKYHYGLIHEKQIYAVASFSHGRKMRRLPEGKLGYELIRFATIPHVSITGGLSKLINCFAKEHSPGDLMTYVDPLNGEIHGLTKLGFKKTENTKPILLHVNTKVHLRVRENKAKEKNVVDFYNLGNVKLVKSFL